MTGISLGLTRDVTTADWLRANSAPNLWPVEGPITGSFGERIDPFNGEGAFHSGVDIGSTDGQPVLAPADGVIVFADFMGGYGRAVVVDHGHGVTTRYGHLGSFACIPASTCIGATPSATSAKADAAPAPTSTTKSASTTLPSTRTSICA